MSMTESESENNHLINNNNPNTSSTIKPIPKPLYKSNFRILTISIIGYVLYIVSLTGCHGTQAECIVNLSPLQIYTIVGSLILSVIVFITISIYCIIGKVNKLHLIYNILVYIMLFNYDKGGSLSSHGSYNSLLFILLSFILIIAFLSIYILVSYILIKHRLYSITALCVFIILYSILIFISNLQSSCKNWQFGLSNEHLINDNSLSSCRIKAPKYCWQYTLDSLFDVSYYIYSNCNDYSIRKGEYEEFYKYHMLSNDEIDMVDMVGYPNTVNWLFIYDSYFKNLQKNVLKNMVFYDSKGNILFNSKDSNKSHILQPEVFLSFDNQKKKGKIHIDLKRNETLVKLNKKKSEEYERIISNAYMNSSISNNTYINNTNILIIYIDSISRPHFLRKMKRTSLFINRFYNKANELNESHNSFQFFKYHNFKNITQFNTIPMLYGQSYYSNNGTHITHFLKDIGYVTGYSNNMCTKEMYDLENDHLHHINFSIYDHELLSLFCDPNYSSPKDPYTPYVGPYSVLKRCLYGRNTFEYTIEYGRQFWKKYFDQKRYLLLAFQDAHEGTGEVIKYLDDYLYDFLNELYIENQLINTSILFVSDHGNKMIGLYQLFNCEDFNKEGVLGSLFLILPYDYLIKNDVKLKVLSNQNRFISPYDIYNTQISLIGYRNIKNIYDSLCKSSIDYKHDIDICLKIEKQFSFIRYRYPYQDSSLFEVIDYNKSCLSFRNDILDEDCRCEVEN